MAGKAKPTPKIVGLRTERGIDWPEGADVLTLAQLHFPGDRERQRWLIELIDLAIIDQRLDAADYKAVMLPLEQALELGMANHLEEPYPEAVKRHLFVIRREAYRDWPDRPPLPPDSPLNGWLADDTPEQLTKRERQIRAILAAIDAEELDRMAVPTKRKAAIKKKLCAEQPALFTPSALDRAWNCASTTGRLAIEDKDRYLKRR